MLVKFTFPTENRIALQSVGIESTSSRITDVKLVAHKILFWGDLYTIVYRFLFEDIEDFETAKKYFEENIDFDCYKKFDEKKKQVNIANTFYFHYDK